MANETPEPANETPEPSVIDLLTTEDLINELFRRKGFGGLLVYFNDTYRGTTTNSGKVMMVKSEFPSKLLTDRETAAWLARTALAQLERPIRTESYNEDE